MCCWGLPGGDERRCESVVLLKLHGHLLPDGSSAGLHAREFGPLEALDHPGRDKSEYFFERQREFPEDLPVVAASAHHTALCEHDRLGLVTAHFVTDLVDQVDSGRATKHEAVDASTDVRRHNERMLDW